MDESDSRLATADQLERRRCMALRIAVVLGEMISDPGDSGGHIRAAARRVFHVDAASITLAVLTQLARRGEVKPEVVHEAIARYHLKNGVTEVGSQPTPETNETQSMGV